jgi:hypothetical protein
MGKAKIRGRKSKVRNAQISAQELANTSGSMLHASFERGSGDQSRGPSSPRASGPKVTKPWPGRNAHENSAARLNSLGQQLLTDIGECRRGRRLATGLAESIVKSLVAKGMVKDQQLRWSQGDAHLMPAPALFSAA